MLVDLDDHVKAHANQDILIVLHQMGNHGPAYYKRYDDEFAQFCLFVQVASWQNVSDKRSLMLMTMRYWRLMTFKTNHRLVGSTNTR